MFARTFNNEMLKNFPCGPMNEMDRRQSRRLSKYGVFNLHPKLIMASKLAIIHTVYGWFWSSFEVFIVVFFCVFFLEHRRAL